jgi:hypothetical protein
VITDILKAFQPMVDSYFSTNAHSFSCRSCSDFGQSSTVIDFIHFQLTISLGDILNIRDVFSSDIVRSACILFIMANPLPDDRCHHFFVDLIKIQVLV